MIQEVLDIVVIIWLLILTIIIILNLKKKNPIIPEVEIPKGKQLVKAKRYIIFDVVTDKNSLTSNDIEEAVRSAVKSLLGNIWLDIANPRVIFFSDEKREGIISASRAGYKVVLASLPLVKEIRETKVLFVPRKTTGSLKRAKQLIGDK